MRLCKEHSPCSLHFVPAAVANLTVSFNVCVPSVRSNETIAGFDWWSDRAESRVSPSLVVLANIFWDSQLRNLGIGQKPSSNLGSHDELQKVGG